MQDDDETDESIPALVARVLADPNLSNRLLDMQERTKAWQAVPSELLHGWQVDSADSDELRVWKQFGTRKRGVIVYSWGDDLLPTPDAIEQVALMILEDEASFLTSH